MKNPFETKNIDWEDKSLIAYKLKQLIYKILLEVYPQMKKLIKLEDIRLEHPSNPEYGDFSSNIAMTLSGKLKKSGQSISSNLASSFSDYLKKGQTKMIKSVSSAGVGFLNFFLSEEFLVDQMSKLLEADENEMISGVLKGKKLMCEFAHPNTHKEFHIGHLRNISIGESLVRILQACGASVFRANYEGDVGLHVAKAIWGIRKRIQNSKLKLDNLRKLTSQEKARFLGEGYTLGSKVYKEDKEAQKEIITLNKQIYQNPYKVDLWQETRRWSLEYFDAVYKRLGTHFDRLFFESEVEERGRKLVLEGVNKGIFIKDKDDSIYFPGSKYNLNDCVFVTKENYATYEGKEIAIEQLEYETFPYDLNIHVVASEQKNFFEIAFKALELVFPHQKNRQYHLAYGMVNLKGGKLSSRTGQVITADELIDTAKEKIVKIIKNVVRGSLDQLKPQEVEKIAEKVAVCAVKYSMLKVNPKAEIAFSLEESVSFEGDSGPYLMYTYARCRSVVRKADLVGFSHKLPKLLKLPKKINEEELALLRAIYRFPEVVVEAAKMLSPNLVCNYLFDLAQNYNNFYNKHQILTQNSKLKTQDDKSEMKNDGKEKEEQLSEVSQFRLALTQATALIVKKGLYLLGIETVERM